MTPRFDDPIEELLTSVEWISRFGLNNGLSPYQEFKDVAYTCSKPGL
jgi:hypothetical protein